MLQAVALCHRQQRNLWKSWGYGPNEGLMLVLFSLTFSFLFHTFLLKNAVAHNMDTKPSLLYSVCFIFCFSHPSRKMNPMCINVYPPQRHLVWVKNIFNEIHYLRPSWDQEDFILTVIFRATEKIRVWVLSFLVCLEALTGRKVLGSISFPVSSVIWSDRLLEKSWGSFLEKNSVWHLETTLDNPLQPTLCS